MSDDQFPMEAVEYRSITVPPFETFTAPAAESLRHDVTLASQGDPAVFVADTSFVSGMIAFCAALEVATRGYIALTPSEWVLVFDHESRSILPPAQVTVADIFTDIRALQKEVVPFLGMAMPKEQETFQAKNVWDAISSDVSLAERTRRFLEESSSRVGQVFSLVIEGEIPLLPAVCLMVLLRPRVQTMTWRAQDETVALFS